jgi:pantetheine-phosphate adenylyltransferase
LLLVDYCHRGGIDVVIRGVRNTSDLDYELPMVRMNHELTGIETLFIPADPSQAYISSSLVTATTNRAQ